SPGDPGDPGQPGEPGNPGTPAVDQGTIQGMVKDGSGAPIAGALVATVPATSTTLTDEAGAFTLADIRIGAYTLTATKETFAEASQEIGVAAGATTLVNVTLSLEPGAAGTITGVVKKASGGGLAGATVAVEGQNLSTVTAADGTFTLAGVVPGFVFVDVDAPEGFLDGGDRRSQYVAPGAAVSVTIQLSGRPSDTATYTGEGGCVGCHSGIATEQHKAGHHRFLNPGTDRMVRKDMWPAVGTTLDPRVQALDPVDGTTMVAVYLCQNTAGAYAMKFGGAADCTVGDGTLIPVSATIGGEGDGGVDGRPNFGVYKQRYLARPADVPYAVSHWAVAYRSDADRDRDYLILPVYLVQNGNTDPTLGAVSPKFYKIYADKWLKQVRTISRLCSGCHATGLKIAYEGAESLVSTYEYKDLNVTCERCHGPGSEHVAPPSGVNRVDRIIKPSLLTAKAAQETCGQCHSAHSASSKVPDGAFKMPFNGDRLTAIGNGVFVPGIYELADYVKGFDVPLLDGGGVETWPDRTHSKAHGQQLPMLWRSKHANNSFERLACFDCHDAHSTYGGPAAMSMSAGSGAYVLENPALKDNTLCLACHASHGPFAGVSKDDVAALHATNGAVVKDGAPAAFDAAATAAAKTRIARAVGEHMQAGSAMGLAAYDPLDDANPVGRCQACHMPKTGKKNDTIDVTQWILGRDANGDSAIIEGNVASHVFDVVWPAQSGALKKATGGVDLDIMPNSCGKCHPASRLSGD
ncbi:MAG TPA: carboxypeptidase-like regulatory domain-containing protein, partial [Anaeromyxobacteraceae bacterium]|nr:carboxypeptidase-like regulatory domain-containing protein [Anaeromyxobacteraceae bacterium]